MNEELDFNDYPSLHLHLMVDDYYELCEEGNNAEANTDTISARGEEWFKNQMEELSVTLSS